MTDKSNKNKYVILLVEDEVNIAKLFSYNLSKAGYTCEVAKNGKEGLEKAAVLKPDLIISDIMMPVIDGFEFRRALLENPELSSTPFIFLTAKGEEDDILQGYDLEIEDYIIKTSSPKIILAKVSAILKTIEKERGKVVGEVQKAADSMGAKVVPDEFPQFTGFEIKHWHIPFKNVPGGDFIDYFKLDDENIVVVLGDVMGKRWGAWYFAVAYAGYVRSAVRMVLESAKTPKPSEILKMVNDAVYKDERISEVFITISVIVLNNKNKTLQYSGAGDLPIIYKGSEVKTLQSKGILLGFKEKGDYSDIEISLNKNDGIFLCTDGIIESRNAAGEDYGREKLTGCIGSLKDNEDYLEVLKKDFVDFTNNEFEDDVSLVVIKSL